MPRKIIPLVTGEKYHVFNRGSDKREIFSDTSDFLRFYQSLAFFNTIEPTVNYRLAKSSYTKVRKKLVNIIAYSLLPNHFHMIVEQVTDGGLSEFMKRLSGGYTSYYNEKYERSGILFQGTYKKVLISSAEQYQYLFAYVNENQFVHDIKFEREICHSSSLHYQKKSNSKIITNQVDNYNHTEARLLAESMYKKRKGENEFFE